MNLPLDTIICGDNRDVLAMFPEDSVDLIVTSPPYDDLREYGGHSWDFEAVAAQLVRVLKPGSVLVWVVGDQTVDGSETGSSMRQALRFMELGLRLHDTMIYATAKPPQTGDRYQQCWEYMFVLSAGKPKTVHLLTETCRYKGWQTTARYRRRDGDLGATTDQDGRTAKRTIAETKPRENIWWYPSGNSWSGPKRKTSIEHPAVFPLQLAGDHILTWTDEGDVVLDPFVGSGTTCVAAAENGRHFIGIDVNPGYCEMARRAIPKLLWK
jgi:site-specific DNA-methyltransferase (adenine-specific)